MSAMKRLGHPLAICAAALAALPFLVSAIGFTYGLATEIALFALVGLGYNLLLGYTGLLSFGHGLFFGCAAYAAALTQIHWFKSGIFAPLAFTLAFSAALGVAVGFLVLRRRGVYFSLLTLAFTALAFTVAFRWTDFTGGESGLRGIRRPSVLGLNLDHQLVFYYFAAALVFGAAWVAWRIVHSPFGSVLAAIRENEQRAAFIGYPVRRYKLAAFAVSATITGLAGALFAFLKLFASADPVHPTFSGELAAMTIIGGTGNFLGPPLGALFYILFREILSGYTASWMFWFGLLFMGFILFSPAGLIGLGERIAAQFRRRREDLAAMASRLNPLPSQEVPAFLVRGDSLAPGDTILSAGQVRKKFGDFTAVNSVGIQVRHARLQALIGPNGAGKTTLFNVLSGMYPPDAGKVEFRGQAISGMPPERFVALGIARSFQVTNLFPGLSVFENLRLGMQAHDPRRFDMWRAKEELDEVSVRTRELIRFLGLEGVEAAPVSTLSYGGPMVKSLARHMGVLLVEHDIDRVFEFSDSITAMANGTVLAEGNAEQVSENRQVQEVYLGSGRKVVMESSSPSPKRDGEILLELEGVNTYYGKSHILHDVSLVAREHQVTALLGRNGAGKSSTLKSIMGLVATASGAIRFDGKAIDGRSPEPIARAGIGLVPQGRRLFPGLTVAENLKLGGLARTSKGGEGVHWDEQRIFGYFPRLREKLGTKADVLSGGEQQMVAIARALSGNVRLLLLDEPFEGLAPAVVEEVFKSLDQLRREIAILIIEHDLDLVLALADRAYVLDRGRVSHSGPAQPLLTDLAFRKSVLWV